MRPKMKPNRLRNIYKSLTNTVLFVNTTIGLSEELFLVSGVFYALVYMIINAL